jgi:hypothetical protein
MATDIVDTFKLVDSLQHIRQLLCLVPETLMFFEELLAVRIFTIHVDGLRIQRCLAAFWRRNGDIHFVGEDFVGVGKLWLSQIRDIVFFAVGRHTRYHPVGCPFAGLASTEVSAKRMLGFLAIALEILGKVGA